MVYQLKTFCGCQNVEEGSKTVAILQMVAGVVYAAISIYNDMIQGEREKGEYFPHIFHLKLSHM